MSVASGAVRLSDRQCRMLPTDPEGTRQQDCHDQLHEECLTALEGQQFRWNGLAETRTGKTGENQLSR